MAKYDQPAYSEEAVQLILDYLRREMKSIIRRNKERGIGATTIDVLNHFPIRPSVAEFYMKEMEYRGLLRVESVDDSHAMTIEGKLTVFPGEKFYVPMDYRTLSGSPHGKMFLEDYVVCIRSALGPDRP